MRLAVEASDENRDRGCGALDVLRLAAAFAAIGVAWMLIFGW